MSKVQSRHWFLGTALVATVGAAIFAPEEVPDEVIAPVTASAPRTATYTPEQILGIRPRDGGDNPTAAFRPQHWVSPAPKPKASPPKATPAEALAAAKAPPLPFRTLGQFVEDGQLSVFLQYNDKTLIVREGDVVETLYRVEKIGDGKITFLYVPLDERQTLALGEAP